MKITFTSGNETPGARLVSAYAAVEAANKALADELRRFESGVTVYQVTQIDGTIYKLEPPDKGLYPIVLAKARLLVAQADNSIADSHVEANLQALRHGIIEKDDGGGGK